MEEASDHFSHAAFGAQTELLTILPQKVVQAFMTHSKFVLKSQLLITEKRQKVNIFSHLSQSEIRACLSSFCVQLLHELCLTKLLLRSFILIVFACSWQLSWPFQANRLCSVQGMSHEQPWIFTEALYVILTLYASYRFRCKMLWYKKSHISK